MRYVLGALALVFGIFFAACEVRGTWEFLIKDQGEINYIVLAGAGIAAALSLLPAWAALAWRGRWVLSITLWVMFIACLGTVVLAAVSRTGSSTDQAQNEREKAAGSQESAVAARKNAEQDVAKAEKALVDARAAATSQAALKTCASNCAALLADAITSAENDLAGARQRLAAARAAVVSVGPPKKDSLAVRIAALFPIFTEDQVRLYQPIAVPVLTSTLSAILTALGIWALFGMQPPARPAKQAARADAPDVKLAAAEPATLAVAEPVPLAVVKTEPLATAPEPAVIEPQPLQIEGPGKRSPVSPFASNAIVRDRSSELHLRDARRAYENFCRSKNEEPLELPVFVRELASLCERTNIGVRVQGKDVYLIGARLANHAPG